MTEKDLATKALLLAFKTVLKKHIGLTEAQWMDILRAVNMELHKILKISDESGN